MNNITYKLKSDNSVNNEPSDKRKRPQLNEILKHNLLSSKYMHHLWHKSPLAQTFTDIQKIYVENPFLGMKGRFISSDTEPKISKNISIDISTLNVKAWEKATNESQLNIELVLHILNKLDEKQLESLCNAITIEEKTINGRYWDMAYRPHGKNPVHIITQDYRTGKFLFILQPRSPVKKFVLSSPAGLIDKKNFSTLLEEYKNEPETIQKINQFKNDKKFYRSDKMIESNEDIEYINAIAELKEETGFLPIDIFKISPHALPKSAGLTDESGIMFYAIVDYRDWGNSKFDVDSKGKVIEDIKYIWLSAKNYLECCKKMDSSIIVAELETWMFMFAISFSQSDIKNEIKERMSEIKKESIKKSEDSIDNEKCLSKANLNSFFHFSLCAKGFLK